MDVGGEDASSNLRAERSGDPGITRARALQLGRITSGAGDGRLMITRSIFDWAERTPDKTALVYNGSAWSYRSLAQFIALARGYFVRRKAVGAGVAVIATYSLMDFWIFSLALRSLGLTTMAAPSVEAIGELGLPDVRCVVAAAAESWPGLEEMCATEGFRLLSVSVAGGAPLTLDMFPPPDPPGGHILQTSGTTGAYKKVLIDPSFEAEFLRARREVTGINHDSVVCAFDFGGWTGVGYKTPASAWIVGATVVVEQRPQPHLALLHPGITYATVVPAVLAAILAAPQEAFPRSQTMQLSVGGGTTTWAEIERAKARITPHVFNGLGATEVSSFAYTDLHVPEDYRWHKIAPGRVAQVVDEFDRPVPVGEVGLLRVSTKDGPTSYLYDEEATKAFFRDGFFYTGDLGVIRSDGRLALQGRVTGVINVGGQKISPEPIEDKLREAFGVSGVCLFSMQDDAGEEQIHVVIETLAPVDSERLIAVLRSELQGFPRAHVHYVAALPRNAMGKLLRQAVRAQVIGGGSRAKV
jgi:acyl-coenzyme A synthetase/AMP-(fatty) acid ligase